MNKIQIRMAAADDAEALRQIYMPYVEKTPITFEYTVPETEVFKDRIKGILIRYPYLAAVKNGEIAGYAYASALKGREAYDWAVETSIYIKESEKGGRMGTRLYHTLEKILRLQRITNVYACITYPNPASIQFHKHLGYQQVGYFSACGYKHGTWHDVIWLEKMLGEHQTRPEPIIPITAIDKEQLEMCLESCYG